MLQIIHRKRFSKLLLQANYYPLPTLAFIQDQTFRFTILTAQPLGFASLKEGQIEVSYKEKINLVQARNCVAEWVQSD
jgi:alpha-mannosidase II